MMTGVRGRLAVIASSAGGKCQVIAVVVQSWLSYRGLIISVGIGVLNAG